MYISRINNSSPKIQSAAKREKAANSNTAATNNNLLHINEIPVYAVKSNFTPAFGKFRKVSDVYLLERDTGKYTTASLLKERIGNYVSFKIKKGQEEAGYIDMKCDSLFPEDIYVLPEPNNIIPEIQHLRSLRGDKYAGIGTALINAAIKESMERGKGGCLWAKTEKGYDFSASEYRSNENPIPFYYKLGFKSLNPETDNFIKNCIKDSNYEMLPKSTVLILTSDTVQSKLYKNV